MRDTSYELRDTSYELRDTRRRTLHITDHSSWPLRPRRYVPLYVPVCMYARKKNQHVNRDKHNPSGEKYSRSEYRCTGQVPIVPYLSPWQDICRQQRQLFSPWAIPATQGTPLAQPRVAWLVTRSPLPADLFVGLESTMTDWTIERK